MFRLQTKTHQELLNLLDSVPGMGTNSSAYHVFDKLAAYANTGATVTVGNTRAAGVGYYGDGSGDGSITANITDVADISSPSGWTDLINVTHTSPFILFFDSTGYEENVPYAKPICDDVYWPLAAVAVDAAEASNSGLRLQVLIDGTIAADLQVESDNSSDGFLEARLPYTAWGATYDTIGSPYNYWQHYQCITCEASFQIKAAKEGAFTNADSYVWFWEHGYYHQWNIND